MTARPSALHPSAGTLSVRALLTLTKPRISALSVATAAVGYCLAPEHRSLAVAASTLLGTALIVGSANTLNMYVERDTDALMARTCRRPLPSGQLHPNDALFFGLLQGVLGLGLLGLGANALTGLLGALALALYVLVYTPLKRRSVHALLVGAVPGAMPPLLGWTASTNELSGGGLALFGLLFIWQIPHFLALSLCLREQYRAAGLKVLPNVAGLTLTRVTIVGTLILLWLESLLPARFGLGGAVYVVGAVALGGLLVGFGLVGLFRPEDARWPRRLFAATILYLTLLLALLVAG